MWSIVDKKFFFKSSQCWEFYKGYALIALKCFFPPQRTNSLVISTSGQRYPDFQVRTNYGGHGMLGKRRILLTVSMTNKEMSGKLSVKWSAVSIVSFKSEQICLFNFSEPIYRQECRLCPCVPVKRGNNHCTPFFTNLCLAVEHLLGQNIKNRTGSLPRFFKGRG